MKKITKTILSIAIMCLGTNHIVTAQCSASYSYTTTNSSISANSTSTGTTSTTMYNWSIASTGGSGTSPVFNSLYNGSYVLSLSLFDSSGCNSTSSQTITISGGQSAPACSASYAYATGSAGSVNFTNTSPVDPYSNTNYTWYFGNSGNSSANSANPTFTYYYNGTYTVTLNLYNNVSGCSTSSTQTITITNAAGGTLPACNSDFTYTVGATGEVSFTSLSTDTMYTGNSIYNWLFEPGQGSNLKNPTYTYAYNGVYSVSLNITDSLANCYSSTTHTLSITNTANPPCMPSVSFYMHKDSLNPQPGVWEISPSYSSQVDSARWYWGDGSSTVGLFPGHNYATADQYTICVTVYSNCGDSSTTCQNDSLYRMAHPNSTNSVIQVTVVSTTAGIKTNTQETAQISVYPNPSTGVFTLQLTNVSSATKAQVSITNVLGEVIYSSQESINGNVLSKEIDLQNMANGAYFMKINVGDKTYTNKTIINK